MVVLKARKYKGSMTLVSGPGEVIERAATAMRESRSSDYFILAKVALQILHRDDLLDVLEQRSPAQPAEGTVYASPQSFPLNGAAKPPPMPEAKRKARQLEGLSA
jgi:hypothetical protein